LDRCNEEEPGFTRGTQLYGREQKWHSLLGRGKRETNTRGGNEAAAVGNANQAEESGKERKRLFSGGEMNRSAILSLKGVLLEDRTHPPSSSSLYKFKKGSVIKKKENISPAEEGNVERDWV